MWDSCWVPRLNDGFLLLNDINVEEQSSQGNYVPCPPLWPAIGAVDNLCGPVSAREGGGGGNGGSPHQQQQQLPPIIFAVGTAAATCNLSGSTLFMLQCVYGGGWRWLVAVEAADGSSRWWTTVSMAVNGNSGRPHPPFSLAVARQLSADNGQWPAKGWWEAELFTIKILGALA